MPDMELLTKDVIDNLKVLKHIMAPDSARTLEGGANHHLRNVMAHRDLVPPEGCAILSNGRWNY